jgi:hypothetical protein
MADARDVLLMKRKADGRWPVEAAHPGEVALCYGDAAPAQPVEYAAGIACAETVRPRVTAPTKKLSASRPRRPLAGAVGIHAAAAQITCQNGAEQANLGHTASWG